MKNNAEKTLTMKSKILVKFSTNPANMGYDGRPDDWNNIRGEIMGMRQALEFRGKIDELIGSGTYRVIKYYRHGQEVTAAAIMDIVNAADYKKWGKTK